MAIYGIGCTYDDIDVSDNFITNGIVCIGWEEKEMGGRDHCRDEW